MTGAVGALRGCKTRGYLFSVFPRSRKIRLHFTKHEHRTLRTACVRSTSQNASPGKMRAASWQMVAASREARCLNCIATSDLNAGLPKDGQSAALAGTQYPLVSLQSHGAGARGHPAGAHGHPPTQGTPQLAARARISSRPSPSKTTNPTAGHSPRRPAACRRAAPAASVRGAPLHAPRSLLPARRRPCPGCSLPPQPRAAGTARIPPSVCSRAPRRTCRRTHAAPRAAAPSQRTRICPTRPLCSRACPAAGAARRPSARVDPFQPRARVEEGFRDFADSAIPRRSSARASGPWPWPWPCPRPRPRQRPRPCT